LGVGEGEWVWETEGQEVWEGVRENVPEKEEVCEGEEDREGDRVDESVGDFEAASREKEAIKVGDPEWLEEGQKVGVMVTLEVPPFPSPQTRVPLGVEDKLAVVDTVDVRVTEATEVGLEVGVAQGVGVGVEITEFVALVLGLGEDVEECVTEMLPGAFKSENVIEEEAEALGEVVPAQGKKMGVKEPRCKEGLVVEDAVGEGVPSSPSL